MTTLFTSAQLAFLAAQRVGHLATADTAGSPSVIPVCYAYDQAALYIALDTKPKRVAPTQLKRVRNILANPAVAVVIDRYDEDWTHLAYLLVRGRAALLLSEDATHASAIALLRARYAQYKTMPIETQPVIVVTPTTIVAWSALDTKSV